MRQAEKWALKACDVIETKGDTITVDISALEKLLADNERLKIEKESLLLVVELIRQHLAKSIDLCKSTPQTAEKEVDADD